MEERLCQQPQRRRPHEECEHLEFGPQEGTDHIPAAGDEQGDPAQEGEGAEEDERKRF